MILDYQKWRDGEGYDLDALAEMNDLERATVEKNLIARLSSGGDPRDIEALHFLGTPASYAAIEAARHSSNPVVAGAALLALSSDVPGAMEYDILRLLDQVKDASGLGRALRLAESCNTQRVRATLLSKARTADDPVVRVHMAALLFFLCGKSDEAFDWNDRPFFLRFALQADLPSAWNELLDILRDYERPSSRAGLPC